MRHACLARFGGACGNGGNFYSRLTAHDSGDSILGHAKTPCVGARHVVGRERRGGWLVVRRVDWFHRARVGDSSLWIYFNRTNNSHDLVVSRGVFYVEAQTNSCSRHSGFMRADWLDIAVKVLQTVHFQWPGSICAVAVPPSAASILFSISLATSWADFKSMSPESCT